MDRFRNYLYYILIGVISILVLVFVPMIGSEAGLGFNFPNTASGWIVYIMTKLIIAVLNISIFYCFLQQAKINIRDNDKYKQANEILLRESKKDYTPRSPKKWQSQQYKVKGLSIFIFSLLGCIALTNAILTYDYMSLLTYFLVLIIGLIGGILEMKNAEYYWTNEYYEYANEYKNKLDNKLVEDCLINYEITRKFISNFNESNSLDKIYEETQKSQNHKIFALKIDVNNKEEIDDNNR